MNICVSPLSLKLYSSYINREITKNLTENIPSNELLQNLFAKSIELLSDNKLNLERNKEIILQHFAITPSLILKQISNNPLTLNNAVSKNDIENAANIFYAGLKDSDFLKVFNNLNALLNNSVIKIPKVEKKLDDNFNAIADILTRTGNQEAEEANVKSNIPAENKKLEFAIIRNILNSNNLENLKLKLFKAADIINNKDFKNTVPNFILSIKHVLVLVNSANEIVKFNSDGSINEKDGFFTAYYYKTDKSQLTIQKNRLAELFLKSNPNTTKEQAEEKANEQIEDYLNFINEQQSKVEKGLNVTFAINTNTSSFGFVKEDRNKPVNLSNINNIEPGKAEIIKTKRGPSYYPEIKVQNSNKTFQVFGKSLASLSDKDFEILHNILSSNEVKTLNTNGNTDSSKTNDKLKKQLINFYLQNSKNPELYGFRYFEQDGVEQVQLFEKIFEASKLTINNLKDFAKSKQLDKEITDKNRIKYAFASYEETTELGQDYKDVDGKVYERNGVRLNFSWQEKDDVSKLIDKVPVDIVDGVIIYGDKITYGEHIKKNGYIVGQLNDENNLIGVGAYLTFEKSVDDIINDINNSTDFDFKFQSVDKNSIETQYTDKQNQAGLDWFYKSLFFTEKKLSLELSNLVSKNGPNFLASFFNNVITLYKGSQYTALYHESFHPFFDNILTPDEQKYIYSTLRKTPGSFSVTVYGVNKTVAYSEATNLEIQEYLAEKFKEYAISDGKKTTVKDNKIIAFFKKLLDLLKSTFGGISTKQDLALAKTNNLENLLFSKLYNQEFDVSKYNATPQDEKFQSVESTFKNDSFDIQEMYIIMESMHSFAQELKIQALTLTDYKSDEIQNAAAKTLFSMTLFDIASDKYKELNKDLLALQNANKGSSMDFILNRQNTENYQDITLMYVKARFNQILKFYEKEYEIKKSTVLKNKISLIKRVLKEENFGNIKENSEYDTFSKLYVNEFIKNNATSNLRVELEQQKTLNVDNEYDENTSDTLSENGEEEGFEGSWFSNNDEKLLAEDTVPLEIRELLSEIHQYSQNGYGVAVVNQLGARKLMPWKTVYSMLLKTLNNETDAERISKILFQNQHNKILQQVYRMLGDIHTMDGRKNQTTTSTKLWGNFLQAVVKASIPQVEVVINLTQNTITGEKIIESKVGNFSQERSNVKNIWNEKFNSQLNQKSNYVSRKNDGNQEANFNTEVLYNQYVKNNGKQYYGLLTGTNIIDDKGEIAPRITDDINVKNYWVKLGVTYTSRPANKALADPIAFLNELGIYVEDSDIVRQSFYNGSADFNSSNINHLTTSLENRMTSTNQNNKTITNLFDFFKGFEYINKDGKIEKQPTLNGILGYLEQLHTKNSSEYTSFTDFTSENERVSTKQYYSTATLLVSNYNTSDNLEDFLSKPGMAYLDPEVNYTAASTNWYNSMFDFKTGKKKNAKVTTSGIGGSKIVVEIISEEENTDPLEDPKQLSKRYEKGKKALKSDEDTKLLSDVLLTDANLQEIMRSETKTTSLVIKVGTEQLISINDLNTINSDSYKNGTKIFDIFKNLIAAELIRINQVKKLINLVTAGKINISDLVVNAEQLNRSKSWMQFTNVLSDDSKDALAKINISELKDIESIKKETKELIDRDLVNYIKNNKDVELNQKFATVNLPANILEKYGSPKIAKQSFLINNFIQNLNYQNLFLGDSSNFDIKGDKFFKRIHGMIASGKIFRNDNAYQDFINSDKFKPFEFSKLHLKDSEIKRDFLYNGEINTGVIDEIMSESVYLESYDLFIPGKTDPYKNMEEANGQGYIGFELYRILSDAIGEWSPAQEKLYQKMLAFAKGEKVFFTEKEITNTTFPVKKFQLFGNVLNKESEAILKEAGIFFSQTAFHKYSLIPLVPLLINDSPALKLLNEKMMEQNMGYVTLKTGSKLSTLSKVKLENGEFKNVENKFYDGKTRTTNTNFVFNKNTVNVSSLKSQKFIAEGYKKRIKVPTQLRKIALLNIFNNDGVPYDYKQDKTSWENLTQVAKIKASNLYSWKNRIEKSLKTLSDTIKSELLEDIEFKEIKKNGKVTYDGKTEVLLNYIINNLDSDVYLDEQKAFLKDKDGNLIKDVSTSLIAEKIEQVVVNLLAKKIRNIEIAGESLINVSGAMFEKTTLNPTQADLLKYGTGGLTTMYAKDKVTGEILKDKNGEFVVESMQVKIALQADFTKFLKTEFNGVPITVYKQDENNKRVVDYFASLANLNKAIKDENWLKENKALVTLPGVRIPVQGANALVSVTVGEFLPYFAGPIVILPAEIVAMSGSDYDVDTIFMMYKNLLLVDNKVIEVKHDPSITETRAQLLEEKNKIKLELTAINKKIDDYSTERKEELDNNLIINNFKFLIEKNNNEIINNNIAIKKIYDSRDIFLTKKIQLASEFENDNSVLLKENKEFNTIINQELKDTKYESLLAEEKNKNEELNNINIKIASKSTLGIENELQNLFSEIILMPSNFKHIITPNSTIDVKKIAEDAFEKRKIKEYSNNPFEYHTNLKKHQEYSVGMDGLGKAAVAATFYALFTTFKNKATLIGKTQAEVNSFTAALKVISDKSKIGSVDYNKAEKLIASYNDVVLKVKHNKNNGAISLGLTDNVDGKNIGNILSQLINAYVDIASDPFIYKAQGTKENTHVLLYMVMSGMSFKDAVSISNHPLVIEYNRLRKKYSGIFNVLNDEVSDKKNIQSINQKAMNDVAQIYENVLEKYMGEFGVSSNKLNNQAKEFSSDELFEQIASDLNKEDRTDEENKKDAQIFALYLKINELADDLNSFIQITRYDTKKIDSIQTAQEAIDDIIEEKARKKSYDNEWFDEIDNSTVGSFNQYQFFIDLVAKNFSIRNNPELLKAIGRLKSSDIPIGTKKATITSQYKNDFMWFLYQNAVYTDNNYTLSSGEGYKLKPTNSNFKEGYKINYEDKTIEYNEDTLYQKIFFGESESIYSNAQVYFKIETPKSLARFILEHDILSEKYNNKSVSNEEFKEKFYQFDNLQTTLIEVEDDYSVGNRNQLIIRAALYNSGNVTSMFTQTNGVNKMLSFFKQKYPDLNEYQFFQDMNVATKKNSNYLLSKTNMYFNNIKDAKAVAVYKKNIADLKNHEAAEVREFFKRFNHIALMQTGLRLGSKYDLAKLTDNNVFVEIIDDFIPMFKIQDALSPATNDQEQSSFAINSIINQFDALFKESIKNGNHIDKIRGFDYTVNELSLDRKKSLKKIEGYVNNFSIINDVKSLEPGVQLLTQVDILALYKKDSFESLDKTVKYAILNSKIKISDKRKQKRLDQALLTLGINNSEELPQLVYATKDKLISPIQINNSKIKKGWYFVKDLGMAATATKVIAQKIEPLTSTYQSSSNAYIDSIDKSKIADNNKVKFDSKDEVWVFGAGIFEKAYSGYKKEDYENKVVNSFNNYYKVNIDAAINAGVKTFIVGSASGIDQYTREYLKEMGFKQAFVYAKAGNFFKFVKDENSVAVQNQNFDPFGPVFKLENNEVLRKILPGVYKNYEAPEYFNKLQDKIVDESLKTKIRTELNNAIVKNNLNKDFTNMLLSSKNERIQIKSDPFFSIIEQMLMEKRADLQKAVKPTQSSTSDLPGSDTRINIYDGTGENAELSNFAVRPFEGGKVKTNYQTVEGAFQASKLSYTLLTLAEKLPFVNALSKATGAEAKKIGKQIPGLDTKAWDENSSEIMKKILRESFEQNPDALAKLLATGNAILTHTQDKTKWGTEFPKLLMEVRDEIRTTQSSTSVNETTLNQIEEQIKTLPIEIFNSIDIVDNVSNDLLGNKDIFFAMKDVFEENGITDPLLINWAGINKAYFGHPKNIRSTEQLQNLIKNVYINKQIESKYLEFKKNPLALESFKSWIKALSKYPIVFQDIMLTHAIKHITNPQRKSKYVLQLSDVALTQTYGILMNKPHEANRLGKLYDKEVLASVSDAVGHEPSASGKGYWVHIPRTKNTKFTSRITDVSNDKNAPGKFYVEYLETGIEDSPDIDFFETREEAENFIKTLEPDNNSAQFKVNVELLRKLSPSTWCTASGMTAYYVENYDNYLLIVDGVTVAGIEAGEIGSNGKVQVKEVTSRGNNGVSSIDHYDDIFAFFEKHNLDTNNDSLKNSKNAKDKGKSDEDIFQTDEEERNERIFWDRINGEIEYDPPGYNAVYGEEPEYLNEYNHMRDVVFGFKTVQEVLAYENRQDLLFFFNDLPLELKDNEEIANLGVEFDPHNILNISTTVPFYDELVYKAIAANVFVFPYLLAEKQLLPGLRDIYVAGIANREAAINENLLDDLPFSKTSNNLIQGYYDAINDKIVVVASNTPVNEAAKVAIHEVAHRGMLRMAKDLGGLTELGKALFAAEKQLMEKLPELLKRTGHKSLENLMLDYGFTTTSEEGKIKLLMELAARWAETLTDKSKPSWWKEFIENIKNWIKQFTGKTLSEQEVNELVGGFVKYGVKTTQSSTSVETEGVLSVTEADEEIELLKEEIAQLEEEDELTNESNVNVIAARLMPKITPESAAKETGGKVGTRGDIMLNLVDKNGETFDEAALSILGNWPYDMEERQDVTTSDIFNIISEVLLVGKKAYIDSYLNTKEIESKKLQLTALQKLQSTRPAATVNSWSDMNFTAAQEKEVLASLIARFKDFNLYSNQDIINNFNKALAKAKTPEEKNKLIELLNCK